MSLKNLNAIFSLTIDDCMGDGSALCVKSKRDLQLFKQYTLNHTIIMGRKTFESLPGLLPNRKHIVLSGNKQGVDENGVIWYNNWKDIIDLVETNPHEKFFVIGGPGIIEKFSSHISNFFITRFLEICQGDIKISKYLRGYILDSSRFDIEPIVAFVDEDSNIGRLYLHRRKVK